MAKIIDNYILIEKIGSGDFSETLKGRNLVSKEAVAVKTIKLERFLNDTTLRDMIINEIQILKKIEDPNIIKMIKMLKSSNNIYLVYDFLPGGNLRNLLNERKTLPEDICFKYASQILMAFENCLLKEKIIHNNISPNTLYLSENQEILKLKNFLCAKSPLTKKSFSPELLNYTAPEILERGLAEEKSDIFSIGVVIYEMLTGNVPFQPNDSKDEYLKTVRAGFALPSTLSRPSKIILQKCLAYDPEERPSFQELSKLLQHHSSPRAEPFELNNEIEQVIMSDEQMVEKSCRPVASIAAANILTISNNLSSANSLQQQSQQEKQAFNAGGGLSVNTAMSNPLMHAIGNTSGSGTPLNNIQNEGSSLDTSITGGGRETLKRIDRVILRERNKYLFLSQVVGKTLEISSWSFPVNREICIFLLLKKAAVFSRKLATIFEKDPEQDHECWKLLDKFGITNEEFREWKRSRDYNELAALVRAERDNCHAVTERFRKDFFQDLMKLADANEKLRGELSNSTQIQNERVLQASWFFIGKFTHDNIIRDEKLDEKAKKGLLIFANNLLDIVNFENFFDEHIHCSQPLDKQDYFKNLDRGHANELKHRLERKLDNLGRLFYDENFK